MSPRPPIAQFRAVDLAPLAMEIVRGPAGVIRACSPNLLPAYAQSVTARLDHWAEMTPDRSFLAERDGHGGWRHLTFAAALASARALGQALLDRRLDVQRPLVILSGNSITHACLALAALYVGIPYAPISPAYARVSKDFAKLKRIIGALTPGLVFAEAAQDFAPALAAAVPDAVEIVTCDAPLAARPTSDFASLLATLPTAGVDIAHAHVRADTIAKILFTSGSLAAPKPVITTHRMLCANQMMIAEVLRFLRNEPPVLVDWLPWHHSFGGNHNFGLALQHGGTLYIDPGRPTEAGLAETVAALREISPSLFFNVPQGFAMLLPQLAADRGLAENFFRALKLNFFAGASLPDQIRTALDAIAIQTCGERIGMISGFGATETAPSVLFQTDMDPQDPALAHVGLPLPGNELKLVPVDGKINGTYEARVKGPNVTPGYWRDDAMTRAAFDEEGFYRLGDALRLADATRPQKGFIFEGRLGEDFKLTSGTTVNSAALRARMLVAGAPYIRDVVIAGEGRAEVTALIFPDIDACHALAPDPAGLNDVDTLFTHPAVRAKFEALLATLAAVAGGASERICRAALLIAPPCFDAGEITDKGTLNRHAVLANRAAVVAALYAGEFDPLIVGLPAAPASKKPALAWGGRV
jgi:feruloyl-CoA synthase